MPPVVEVKWKRALIVLDVLHCWICGEAFKNGEIAVTSQGMALVAHERCVLKGKVDGC